MYKAADGQHSQLIIEHINDPTAIVMQASTMSSTNAARATGTMSMSDVVSKDLVHWTRLPPPRVPAYDPTGVPLDAAGKASHWCVQHRDYDGSLTILSAEDSPTGQEQAIILEEVVERKKPRPYARLTPRHLRTLAAEQERVQAGDAPTMGVARAMDMDDP